MRALILIGLIIFPLMGPSYASGKDNPRRLIVFHMDFNSVALKESYVRKWLKRAADMGYNAVLWEVEGKVKWKTCPECVSPDAFSKKTFKDILAYSRSLGLEPIPLLQTVGHAEYVLQHERYFSFREDSDRYDCYATCKPEVVKFIKDWIDEYLQLFGKVKYFHLGGDEAYVFATSPDCAREAEKVGKGRLYAEYMTEIAEPLIKRGIRPCVWGDMILKYPNALSSLPKNFVIWDWDYWDGDTMPNAVMLWDKGKMVTREELTSKDIKDYPQIVDGKGNLRAFYTSDFLKQRGYDVVLSSSARSYGDGVFACRQEVHSSNIIGAAKKVVEDSLLGTCVTSWAVRIPNYETQAPWLVLAPLTIEHSRLSRDALLAKSTEFTFGDSAVGIFDALSGIGYAFPFVDEKSTGIMWTGMKDSRPAPPGYVDSLIQVWKDRSGGEQWKKNLRLINAAPDTIMKGLKALDDFIPGAKKGYDVLYAWAKAAHFQFWGWVIANDIAEREEGNLKVENQSDIVRLLNDVKSDYTSWADDWMTPSSAKQNAGLIYDAIIDYFSRTNK